MRNRPNTRHPVPRSKESGIALIITLALIVLVTVAAVAFFTRATSDRVVETSRASQILARQLAESGADYAVSNFILEIVRNSVTTNDASGNTTYSPTNSTNMVPMQLPGATNILPTNLLASSFVNLVRQSQPPSPGLASSFTNVPFETNASTNDNTASPSLNGRIVGLDRWNAPQLIVGGFTANSQLPNWIYVQKDGTLTNAVTTNNVTNIIGRFAYNAYDIGGLLDANVAGYPASINVGDTNMAALKGTLAGADLTQLPGITPDDVSAFIKWRNSDSAGAALDYVNDLTNAAAAGFLNTTNTNGDQFFASRQDLIRYATLQNPDFTNALPYLTHFTRELAVPTITLQNTNFSNRYALTNLTTNNGTALGAVLSNVLTVQTNANEYEPPTGDLGTPNWTDPDPEFKSLGIALDMIDQFNNAVSQDPDTNTGTNNLVVAGKKALPYIGRVYAVCNISPDPTTPGGFVCNASMVPEVWVPPNGSTNCSVNASLGSGTVTVTATPTLGGTAPDPVNLALLAGKGTNSTNSVPDGTSSQGWAENLLFAQVPAAPYAVSGYFAAIPGSIPPPPPPPPGSPPGTSNSYTFAVSIAVNGVSFLLSSAGGVNYTSFGLDPSSPPLAGAPLNINTNLSGLSANSDQNHVYGIAVFAEDPRTVRNAGTEFDFSSELDLSSGTFGNDVVGAGLPDPVTPSVPYPAPITDTNYALPANQIHSVGELGYVFRELPWRTIDFVSGIATISRLNQNGLLNTNGPNAKGPWSADWQLLDLFSAYAAPTNAAGIPVRAGVINLNTRQINVLAAILSGTPTTPGSSISPGDAMNVATAMIGMTSSNSWMTRSQLVDLTFATSTNPPSTIGFDKMGLESIVRALGEVGQVRTWNLLIDVVAQSGQFPATLQTNGTNSMGSQFIVGGEDRIWTSVAIDRLTGQVIDRQTEQVKQ